MKTRGRHRRMHRVAPSNTCVTTMINYIIGATIFTIFAVWGTGII